jgi:hypothetical protein
VWTAAEESSGLVAELVAGSGRVKRGLRLPEQREAQESGLSEE